MNPEMKQRERLAFILMAARFGSELMMVVGMIIIMLMVLRQVL